MKDVKNLRYKRTLFVGLGGAGAKTLRLLKKQIKEVNGNELPGQVKFLLIDTNATDLANYRDFDCSEKICIAVREPYQRYKKDADLPTHKFIPPKNTHSLLALERGAGQIRSNGHFAVIENQYSNKLAQIFRHTAEDLENIDIPGETVERDPKIEVRVVFSIAGGTGSGTFLPISMILRAAIKHSELTAYIYSATHYERIVEKSAKYSVMQNAYASIVELDYMMHFGIKDRYYKPVEFNFGPEENQRIEQNNRPFDEVYYIDKITALPTPDTVEFAYAQLDRIQINTANALHIAATNIISAHTGTIDNVRQKVMEGQFDVADKFAWVSGLGMAELFMNPQNIDSPKIKRIGVSALNARIKKDDIDPITRGRISAAFTKEKWDESGREKDKDPILKHFLTFEEIKTHLENKFKRTANNDFTYKDELRANLDDLLQEKKQKTLQGLIIERTTLFKENLEKFVESLINESSYSDIEVQNCKEYGISIDSLLLILADVRETLVASYTQIEIEKSEKNVGEKREAKNEEDFREQNKQQIAVVVKGWGPFKRRNIITQPTQNLNYGYQLAEKKALARTYLVMGQRDQAALDVIEACLDILDSKVEEVRHWKEVLKKADDERIKEDDSTIKGQDKVKREENRVEVQMADVKNFKIDLPLITELVDIFDAKRYKDGQAIFDDICRKITIDSGSLLKYLQNGIHQIKDLNVDTFNNVGRTECQRKIDRLIDLSTPTMQVDRHSYGERVKVDNFWYIMTNCGEDEVAKTDVERKSIKKKSVGGLLKELLQQNLLDEHVNLVHVSGWDNKAIVYRVKAAVPPYFVEGVCTSDRGGITLESCYEELKKTKRTYTPFSHEELRKKLENGITVLKPHDESTDDFALETWVNYIVLGKVNHDRRDSNNKKVRGVLGTYSVASKRLGEYIVDEMSNHDKILILGDTTRKESYNTFARYCKTLLEEYPEYVDITNPVYNEDYESMFMISGDEYLEKFIIKGDENVRKVLDSLPKDDSDKELIRKEMEYFDKRKKNYKSKIEKDNRNKDINDKHKDGYDSDDE